MRHFIFRSLMALGLGAMALGTAPVASAQERLIVSHSTDSLAFLPFFVANAMNYFQDVELEVEPLRTGSGATAMAAMIGGDAHIYVGSTASAFGARNQGVDVMIVGAMVDQFSSSIVVSKEWADMHNVTADSSIEDKLEALRGIRIGVTGVGSGSEQIVRYLASEAGLDPEREMTIVGMGSQGATLIAALSQDRVDAFSISPPSTHVAVDELDAVILFNTSIGEVESLDGYFYIGAMAQSDWLQEHPDTAVKFLRGLQLALDAFRDPEVTLQARDAVHEMYYSGIDKHVFDAVWVDAARSSPESVEMTREMLAGVVDFANTFTSEQIDPMLVDETFTNEYAAQVTADN